MAYCKLFLICFHIPLSQSQKVKLSIRLHMILQLRLVNNKGFFLPDDRSANFLFIEAKPQTSRSKGLHDHWTKPQGQQRRLVMLV